TSCSLSSDPLQYVDPFIGTDGIVHTFPGATTPFGMVQLSPDGDTKGWNWCSGYHTSDSSIMGFSHTHLSGTGWSDMGDILVMPTIGEIKFSPGDKADPDSGYRSRISHDALHESASAGYYSVDLLDYNIKVELTATPRAGVHRYTFPKSDEANVIFDPVHKIYGKTLMSSVKVLSDTLISGYSLSNGWGGKRYTYFMASFSKPFGKYTIYSDSTILSGSSEATSKDAKIALSFSTTEGEQIVVKVAISSVDVDGAEMNFVAEVATVDFDSARKSAEDAWRDKLSRYEFKTESDAKKRILYTGLYHAMIQPNLSQDVDGRYWAQNKIQRSSGYTNYSTFSLWDTYRAVHPLFSITEHGLTADFANSLISRYESGGEIPLWELAGYDNACMISYPAAAMISEAIVKNISGINEEKALEALVSASNHNYVSSSDGESGVELYNKYGYVPVGIGSSVSKSAENSYYDWCIAQIAAKVGNKVVEKEYLARSMRFLNHFDPRSNLMMPKDTLGNFVDVDLHDWVSLRPHYVSGNIWAY
ncbi:MAG: GH92 family glycosyl hydrolase, partial [Rikenellaceae bacterium]